MVSLTAVEKGGWEEGKDLLSSPCSYQSDYYAKRFEWLYF